jgi:hypothetical protein
MFRDTTETKVTAAVRRTGAGTGDAVRTSVFAEVGAKIRWVVLKFAVSEMLRRYSKDRRRISWVIEICGSLCESWRRKGN